MVLAQKQTYGSMEQNREPSNKPTHLPSINLQQKRKQYTMEKRQSLQQVVLGKLDNHVQINEVRNLPHITHKNKLKRLEDLNIRQNIIKSLEQKINQNIL